MMPSPSLDPELWLQGRTNVIDGLFTQATDSLQAAGIRVLTGSHPPQPECAKNSPCIRLKPVRFSSSDNEAAVELNIKASTSGGPPRYVVTIEIRGTPALQALYQLALNNAACWQRMFVGRGLWITDWRGTYPFNSLSLISEGATQRVTLSVVFLHSERSRAIQEGIMLMGLLYRSVLDELCGAGKMGNLAAVLTECLDGNPPQFQRTVRP